ncbi:hypothetical protein DENSPDRAFT_224861 [Dentipellis sp. KUC8613]|nr:hypothetical protein DENSPDRAFT_224861 [Dentipellis sp. KUC8613]
MGSRTRCRAPRRGGARFWPRGGVPSSWSPRRPAATYEVPSSPDDFISPLLDLVVLPSGPKTVPGRLLIHQHGATSAQRCFRAHGLYCLTVPRLWTSCFEYKHVKLQSSPSLRRDRPREKGPYTARALIDFDGVTRRQFRD